jgi:hypothetical protein
MKNLICLGLMVLLANCIYATDGDYSVSKIPPALLEHANAIKRMEVIRYEVTDLDRATYYTKVAYTILNEKGDKFAKCVEGYDKLRTVESIEGRLYDAFGKKIKSLKRADISDKSGTDDNNLADDNRLKYHNFYHRVYPYTVEYETEVRYNNTMFYPGYIPVDGELLSVENSTMTVYMASGIDFRYKLSGLPEAVMAKEKSGTTYTWSLKNFPAVRLEYASPSWHNILPVVFMGPSQFSIQGYKGNMSSWNDFGKFQLALNQGRDQLPDDIKKTVHQLTDGLSDEKAKISTLYSFLQTNSRYISIQLGIGGWQPFDASYVATRRYGDCKALTNYMYSLLKEAGIRSNYTLVKAGVSEAGIIEDFPSAQFNHVILSVPLKTDTVWLECTSSNLPTGYLSNFTSDRAVLIVNENGGTLARTPKYGLKENLQSRFIEASVDPEGKLSAEVKTTYQAIQEDNVHGLINNLSKEKVLEYLKEEIGLPNYDVISYNYEQVKAIIPSIKEQLKLTAPDYAQVTGKRLFVNPNILSKTSRRLTPDNDRKFEIHLSYEYTDIDTVEITIPAGYLPESMPKNLSLKTAYGAYNSLYKVEDGRIIYIRRMEQYGGRFPASEFPKLLEFCNAIYTADRSKIVMIKN